MAFIRGYRKGDFEATAAICRATLPPSLQASEPARRLAPYLWTHQYTHLSPSTCFVVDDGTGKAVGYCIGCPDIPAFCASYPSYVNTVLEPSTEIHRPANMVTKEPWMKNGVINEDCLAQMAFDVGKLLVDGNEDLAAYRGTMHIDLLEEFQGKGWGRLLIEKLVESVQKESVEVEGGEKSKGLWIGVAGENGKVVKFYERVGFKVKEREGKTGTICMVKEF